MTTLLDRCAAGGCDALARALPRGADVITFDPALVADPAWHRHRVTVLFPPRTPAAAAHAVACALAGVAPGAVVLLPPGVPASAVEPVIRRYAARLVRVA